MSIKALRTEWGDCEDECTENGCKFCVQIENKIVIDCNKLKKKLKKNQEQQQEPEQESKSNDCLIFVQKEISWVGIIELKSSRYKIEEVIGQLKAGFDITEYLLTAKNSQKWKKTPILVAKNHPHSEHQMWRYQKLKVGGRNYQVKIATCGDKFTHKDILAK